MALTVSQPDSQSMRVQTVGCRQELLVLLHSCEQLQSTGLGLWPGVMWVARVATSMSDHTLDVLLYHLRDLDLPTILARIADQLEP